MLDCSYTSAHIVFRGTVDFNDDNGIGTFDQQTFVRFQVSEVFKGLSPTTKHVWVNPGSFTSCYAEYRLGEEYLVFAISPSNISGNPAAIGIATGVESSKPLPKELTIQNSPTVYLAPECTGTHDTRYPDFAKDVGLLRQYAAGTPVPPITGKVFLAPNDPWNRKGGLAGVEVLLETGDGVRRSTTNSDGKFVFNEPLGNGSYTLIAQYPGAETKRSLLHVYSQQCSSTILFLRPVSRRPQKP